VIHRPHPKASRRFCPDVQLHSYAAPSNSVSALSVNISLPVRGILLARVHRQKLTWPTDHPQPTKPQSWVKCTARSLVPEKSSLRPPRYILPVAAAKGGPRPLTQSQVEPQEKKKTPKGRARKRMVYIRRFVNVAMTGGKRKVRSGRSMATAKLTRGR
jgi:small subunit ribosomal protein S30e